MLYLVNQEKKPSNKTDIKIVATRKQYNWSFRPTFKRKEKQFRDSAIATEKEKCRIS